MEHLNSFFNRFKHLAIPHKDAREVCALFCSNLLKREIPLSAIRVKEGCIYIDIPPLLKGEMLLHKKDLLDQVNVKKGGKEMYFTDVR